MRHKKTVKDIEVKGKKVLVRVDFNVPLNEKGEITDDTRIIASLPTISYLREQGAKVILISHLGRPSGKDERLKMDPVAKRLEELLGCKVTKLDDCIGWEVKKRIDEMKSAEVVLLENVRFYLEEEKNDEEFARKLSTLAEVYVNDAFGTAHRAHASTEGITKFLPAVAGLLLEREIETIGNALTSPQRPFITILGGAKVKDKVGVINNFLNLVDYILIGGGMAYTFLKAKGYNIGKSILEEDKIEVAKNIMESAEKKKVKILLPKDVVVADKMDISCNIKIVKVEEIPPDYQGLDIGPETIKEFSEVCKKAKTIIWNGPMGVFELKPFSKGTYDIAKLLSQLNALTIIGGGDTAAAVEQAGLSSKMSHISTGGGASLELMEGRELPGVSALLDK